MLSYEEGISSSVGLSDLTAKFMYIGWFRARELMKCWFYIMLLRNINSESKSMWHLLKKYELKFGGLTHGGKRNAASGDMALVPHGFPQGVRLRVSECQSGWNADIEFIKMQFYI